jgi:hypothetical protein
MLLLLLLLLLLMGCNRAASFHHTVAGGSSRCLPVGISSSSSSSSQVQMAIPQQQRQQQQQRSPLMELLMQMRQIWKASWRRSCVIDEQTCSAMSRHGVGYFFLMSMASMLQNVWSEPRKLIWHVYHSSRHAGTTDDL